MSSENRSQSSSAGLIPAVGDTFAALTSLFTARTHQKAVTVYPGIFEEFDITEVSSLNCDIIGLDIGANEWSASLARPTTDGHYEIIDLCTSDIDENWNDTSALFHSSLSDSWSMGETAAATAKDTPGTLFDNFRVPPDSAYIEECHGFSPGNPSRRVLMQRLFQEIFKQIQSRIPSSGPAADKGFLPRKSVILVSLPSRPEWSHAALPYRDLLVTALKNAGFSCVDVQIAVVPEVQAVLAFLSSQNLQAKIAPCTVAIDVGATSVDAVVVKGGKIAGIYSRKLGASSIEDNLLEIAFCDAFAENASLDERAALTLDDEVANQIREGKKEIHSRLVTRPYFIVESPQSFQFSQFEKYCSCLGVPSTLVKFQLRNLKEQFFKSASSGNSSGFEARALELDNGLRIPVDDKSIRKALYQMPVFVPSDDADAEGLPFRQAMIYRSYYDALSHFMAGLRSQYLKMEYSPQVILTGGASVMPLVSTLVKNHLRVEPVYSSQPRLTVSRVLALIGYEEARKLDNLREIADSVFDIEVSNKNMLSSYIRSKLVKSLVQEELDEIFRWVEDDTMTSPQNFLSMPFQPKFGNYDEQKNTASWWNMFVKDFAMEKVRIQFNEHSTRPTPAFHYQVPNDLIARLPWVQILLSNQAILCISFDPNVVFGKRMAKKLTGGGSPFTTDERMKFYFRAKGGRSQIESFLETYPSIANLISDYADQIISLLQGDFKNSISAYAESLTPYSL